MRRKSSVAGVFAHGAHFGVHALIEIAVLLYIRECSDRHILAECVGGVHGEAELLHVVSDGHELESVRF